MPTVRVERTIEAPIEDVFDLLTDHANYDRFPGITDSELVREGSPERNGLGALRRIAAGPIRFEEEITAFERPRRMDYLIREVNLPLEHEGGTIVLEESDEGTRAAWTSTFRITITGVGAVFAAAGALVIRRSFARILRDTERRLAAA
jgi:uncharacterized protein YndB with AHSA1/START domain